MNIGGIISLVIFYLIVLCVGVWAARKKKKKQQNQQHSNDTEELMLAGRTIGCFVGSFTMTATWVGVVCINQTAESLYTRGVWSTQTPWAYSLSLVIGGLLFAKKMREAGYVTILDPLQERYGKLMGCVLYLPALLGELLWSATVVASLGATLSVIFDSHYSLIAAIVIALSYTFLGGMYSVVYTDVVQLVFIFVGLWISIPFALSHKHTRSITTTSQQWLGEIDQTHLGQWIDSALLLILGGVPWQVYFQRVLSSATARQAQLMSFAAAFGCLAMALPSVLIGAVARSTDWARVESENNGTILMNETIDARHTLPLVLHHLTPPWCSYVALAALSAAVMSSLGSSTLSVSSMFAHNIYNNLLRQKASEREVSRVLRVAILASGGIACALGMTLQRIHTMWRLSCDLVYVCLFPQLLCAVHFKSTNAVGSVAALAVGLVLRVGAGEPLFKFSPFIRYPFYRDDDQQLFPYKTFAMLLSLFTLLLVSFLTRVARKCYHKNGGILNKNQTDAIVQVSYNKAPLENCEVQSFSKISRWSGSYNSITASATELHHRDEKSLLKSTLTRNSRPLIEHETETENL